MSIEAQSTVSSADEEFAPLYSPAEKRKFLLLGVSLGIVVVVASKLWLFPWIKELSVLAPCRTVFGMEGATVFLYAIFVGLPLVACIPVVLGLGWRGYKALRDVQYPPLGTKVVRPTRIVRGSKAKLIGYLHLFAFLPVLALSIWGGFQVNDLAQKIAREPRNCQAVG